MSPCVEHQGFPLYRAVVAAGNLGAMTHRPHRIKPVTGHAYSVPVVRELPQPAVAVAGSTTW